MDSYTLLVVSRSQSLAKRLQAGLEAGHHALRWAASAGQARGLDLKPHLVVVDLPASGGERTVARLREAFGAPILALAGTGQPAPAGAAACLARPFGAAQLVEAVLAALDEGAPDRLRAPGIWLDVKMRRVEVNGAAHRLGPIACQILARLMGRPGCVVGREELGQAAWPGGGDSTRGLDVHIASLRRILEEDARHPRRIVTVRGSGYCFDPVEG